MIECRHLDSETEVVWATPTSGYGHLADEQPLPFIYFRGLGITPQFGGEVGWVECGPTRLGLPYGLLSQSWPLAQRVFNIPRRSLNLYWRNAFSSRCRTDRLFFLHEQLDFAPIGSGFRGTCPLMHFERTFHLGKGVAKVRDVLVFRKALDFAWFAPVVLPLFNEWGVNGDRLPRVDVGNIELNSAGAQCSAAGTAALWTEKLEQASFAAGERLERYYSYRWAVE